MSSDNPSSTDKGVCQSSVCACVRVRVRVCEGVGGVGQLLTWTLAHQVNEKVDTCSPVNS